MLEHTAPGPVIEEFGPASSVSRLVGRLLRLTLHPVLSALAWLARPWSLGAARIVDYVAVVLVAPRGTSREPVKLKDCRAEWVIGAGVTPPKAGSSVILYFHGGAFLSCGLRSHRRLVARISKAAGSPVLNVGYRQLPKHAVASSIADAMGAYEHLLRAGQRAEDIVVAGDSAGGLLAFSVAIAALCDGRPLPAGIVGLSPWLDLDCAALYEHANNATDPYISARMVDAVVRNGFLRRGPLEPAWSPLNGELAGLPSTLIQVGSGEVLRSDAERMGVRLAEAGVPVKVQIWDRQPHVFQAGADVLPEARAAIEQIGHFVRAVTAQAHETVVDTEVA